MSRAKKAVDVINIGARTINLAKQSGKKKPAICDRTCLTGSNPCGEPIPPPPATHIRVCTPEQLRSICPPDPCECPDPPPPPTMLEKFYRSTLFVMKVMIILGICKWTSDLGIWGDTDKTAALTREAGKKLAPALGTDRDSESGHYYGLTYNLGTIWNSGVSKVFYVIGVLPSVAMTKILGKGKKSEEKEAQEPPPDKAPKKASNVQRFY